MLMSEDVAAAHLQTDVIQTISGAHRLGSCAIQHLHADGGATLGLEHITCQVLAGKVAFTAAVGILSA